MKVNIYLALLVAVIISGCGSHTMTLSEIYSVPENPTVKKRVEKDDKEVVFKYQPYDRLLIPYPSILYNAGGKYGLAQKLYFQEEREGEDEFSLSKESIVLVKVFRNGLPYLMSTEKIKFGRKAYIGSRVNNGTVHQYTLDGSWSGVYGNRFSWNNVKPIKEYSNVEISKNVQFDSDVNEETSEFYVDMLEEIKKNQLPDLFKRLMIRIGRITQDDVIFAGATDFQAVYAIIGVRIFAIVEAIMNEADLNLFYYETAKVDMFQLAVSMEPIHEHDDIVFKQSMASINRQNQICDLIEAELEKLRR